MIEVDFGKVRDECLKELIDKDYVRVQPISYLKVLLKQRGYVKVCIWCGNKLYGHHLSYCCAECAMYFYEYRTLPGIRYRLTKERGHQCERCPTETSYLEMHHRIPISEGGDLWDDNNLELLCPECHIREGKKRRIENKLAEAKIKPLSCWGF